MKSLAGRNTKILAPNALKGDSSLEKGCKVSIQGFEGSFHQEAARNFFGKNVEVICCATFREVVKIAENSKESNE